ncbi:MAG: DUF2953 domain-containing protein [Clostridia bacterium]|nr:DUF2953 domain-containing protein [Clostridia bacterium]
MTATIILFIILIFILLTVAIFSVNLNIVISFYASVDNFFKMQDIEDMYKYSISVNRILRRNNKKKRKRKKSKNVLFKNIKKFKKWIEISNITIHGNISSYDAFTTAIFTGIINSFAGIFIAFLSTCCSKISLSKVEIFPIYNEKIQGDIFFECIVKTNTGNIITESIKHFFNTKRQKNKERKQKNVKSNK